MFLPRVKDPTSYHELITSYQIVQYHIVDNSQRGCANTPALRHTVLFSSSSPRMIWLALREIKNMHPYLPDMHIHVMQEGQLRRMSIWHFIVMFHKHYIYHDFGQDSPFIEWIEVYELIGNQAVMTYTGAWWEVYRQLEKWGPERTKYAWAKIMRQNRPPALHNPPYINFAYGSCTNLYEDYGNWMALMTYDKHADYYPIFDEADEANAA